MRTPTLVAPMILLVAAIAAQAGTPTDATAPLRSGIDTSAFDRSVRPQDDFYRYVNGGWLDRHPIPDDAVRISAASEVDDATRAQLRTIVESLRAAAPTDDADARRIGALYASFMDEAAAERRGLRPLRADLARIDALRDAGDVATLIGELGRIGVRTPVGNSILNDGRDPHAYIETLHQDGLGMPGREYYLGDEPAMREIRAAYLAHVERMLRLAGARDAADGAQRVLDLETQLARAQWTYADSSDPAKSDNRYTLARLQAFAPGLPWRRFLAANETARRADAFVVAEPDYLRTLAQLAGHAPRATWRAYFRYQLLSAYAPYLDARFGDEAFAFSGRQLRGIPANAPRWKRGLDLVDATLGEALGRLYVARYVAPQAKARVAAMIPYFVDAFAADIDTLDWMGDATRRKAQAKLRALRAKIAWPDRWRDYAGLRIVAGDLAGNVRRARLWEYRRNVAKLGKPVDRDEWYMTPQTPDAYAWAPQNEIVVGAALLQPPFFDAGADDAVNYGAIGGTLGHEISHDFDTIGSQYDADGRWLGKPGWFTAEDQQRFDARTRALVAQYSTFEPVPGYRVDGLQTLTENIADVAGAAIAYRAYRLSLGDREAPVIDGLTGDQRFFIGWAQRRRGNYRERELIRILKSDEHSPPAIRAVAPLMNLEAFHAAFGIRAGDRMYLAPAERVAIW
ncbi:MAG TPA: M13 family metallopeptidase [Dokdonella sp.]|nr:M13 family metallopeptidase [Dokdonella sp.]